MTFARIASASELWDGEKRCFVVEGRPVLLVKVEGRIYAYENRCAHRGLPLGGGRLDGHVLTCPVHEWQYDVRTGHGVNPNGARLRAVPLRIEADDVWVDVEPPAIGFGGTG